MKPADSPTERGRLLLRLARQAIDATLGGPAPAGDTGSPALTAPGACFVTLTRDGQLRGCIGSLEAHRSLAEDIAANARAAAFRDPRFAPVSMDEWPALQLEVSVLGPIAWRDCPTLASAIDWARKPDYGAVLQAQGRRATFLPQVWDTLGDPDLFFGALLRKAGLPGDHWPDDAQVGRYTVEKYREAA